MRKGDRLVEVTRKVNRMRRRLKREYFDQRLDGVIGDHRATREVLGEVLRGFCGRAGLARQYYSSTGK